MNYLYDLWDDFISLLFPRICAGCGNHLLRNEKLICTECHVLIPRTNYHLQKDNPVAQLFWGRCMIEKAAAFSFYNRGSRIRTIIHKIKYKGARDVGFEIGKVYGQILRKSDFLDGIDFIIPVPLHASKERIRGFNQSRVISEGLSESADLPVLTDVLVRINESATQTKRSRYERWVNVEGIFSIRDIERIKGTHILLLDDVITTGSTIEACANELLKIEGVKVSVAAVAAAVL